MHYSNYQYYLFMNCENQIHLFVIAAVIKVIGGVSVVLQGWFTILCKSLSITKSILNVYISRKEYSNF